MKTLLATLALAACLCAQAPNYPAAGIVNGASFGPSLAPNTVASLFGTKLAWGTQTLQASDVAGGVLPTTLGGVRVFVSGYAAHLYFVSPLQVNFLVPNYLLPGTVDVWVARDGMSGPAVQIKLDDAAPALFQTADGVPIAAHLDWSLITSDAPAHAGEIIVVYAAGLGHVDSGAGCQDNAGVYDDGPDGAFPPTAERLCGMSQFSVWMGGAPMDAGLILYAGVAPGFAGVYQVNMRMPAQFAPNPELRLAMGNFMSKAGLLLPAQ
jgi:uncharacterized protein (TIGR03437 family)